MWSDLAWPAVALCGIVFAWRLSVAWLAGIASERKELRVLFDDLSKRIVHQEIHLAKYPSPDSVAQMQDEVEKLLPREGAEKIVTQVNKLTEEVARIGALVDHRVNAESLGSFAGVNS